MARNLRNTQTEAGHSPGAPLPERAPRLVARLPGLLGAGTEPQPTGTHFFHLGVAGGPVPRLQLLYKLYDAAGRFPSVVTKKELAHMHKALAGGKAITRDAPTAAEIVSDLLESQGATRAVVGLFDAGTHRHHPDSQCGSAVRRDSRAMTPHLSPPVDHPYKET